jgi:hypothetical protein
LYLRDEASTETEVRVRPTLENSMYLGKGKAIAVLFISPYVEWAVVFRVARRGPVEDSRGV